MKVNGPELLLTIEATLVDFLPLPTSLTLQAGVNVSENHLGGWSHGQELDWQGAWAVLRHPDYMSNWRIVPLQGGRLILSHVSALPDRHLQAAELWQERAAGLLFLTAHP